MTIVHSAKILHRVFRVLRGGMWLAESSSRGSVAVLVMLILLVA